MLPNPYRLDNNSVTIKTNVNHDALLVLTDIYYPGWIALVDGKKTKIFRVDGLVRGIVVPAGSHTIVYRYFPHTFQLGLWLAGTSLLVCIMIVFIAI